mmetsp:Transcript_23383/g.59746  ORF Transcript_23383/g.59746 Transcript_23383/m.59746 type:complete len:251 (+) Transcript_23383:335-1087(+)
MLSTISHSGPRPRCSTSCVHWLPCNARRITSGLATSSSLCPASTMTALICFTRSRSWREVCVTKRWKPRDGIVRERNSSGICFSWRFSSLRKPATLISRYCAWWFATSISTLHCTARRSMSVVILPGSLRIRRFSRCRARAARSCAVLGSTFSRRSSCTSCTRMPASMALSCSWARWAERRSSPCRTYARMRARSSSTTTKSCRSSSRMRSTSSDGEAALLAASPPLKLPPPAASASGPPPYCVLCTRAW